MRIGWSLLGIAGLAAAAPLPALAPAPDPAIPAQSRSCPAGLDVVAQCYEGRDSNGAWYLAAVPRQWNQVLVVHAHGGPRLGVPKAGDSDEDLERSTAIVRQGYAWIGSTYRRGGYGVRMAAADVDNSRAIFWQQFGRPRLTILRGQSYGANVAAKAAELHALDLQGNRNFDGVLLTNGVLWGGTRAYGFRADLRAVYQYFCRNHPGADEPQYPLWQGLPLASGMTRAELERRVNACTGVGLPPKQRTPEQQKRLTAITKTANIDADHLLGHLGWATFTFRDLVQLRLGGRNPFDNTRTIYRGSGEDRALNRDIARFKADPEAVAALAYDSDLTGQIILPTIAIHARYDPIASAQADAHYGRQVAAAGNSRLLLQFLTNEDDHSRLSDSEVLAALAGLTEWIETGAKPAHEQIEAHCEVHRRATSQPCLFAGRPE